MMLLPSPFPCEQRQRPALPRLAQYARDRAYSPAPLLVQQPPPQMPSLRASAVGQTCRALQSILGMQPPASSLNKQPYARAATNTTASPLHASARVRKHPPLPPRGRNKRLRDAFEDDSADDAATGPSSDQENYTTTMTACGPRTPKRQRRAPPNIPFGLARSDFYDLPVTPPPGSGLSLSSAAAAAAADAAGRPSEVVKDATAADDSEGEWEEEDDRVLVDLVLEKLQLTRRAWDECARVLGADHRSLGRRWKYLVDEGRVGLKIRRGGKQRRGNVAGIWDDAEA